MSLNRAAFARLVVTSSELVGQAGAATVEAIHREFPYCGYSVDEVLEGLDVMVEVAILNQITDGALRIYVPGPGFPKPIEVDR